jgi:hypothetical protein
MGVFGIGGIDIPEKGGSLAIGRCVDDFTRGYVAKSIRGVSGIFGRAVVSLAFPNCTDSS